jgi:pimeloyl-ACP methyl ester carboxylesterase
MTLAAIAPERLAGVILNDIGPEIDQSGIARIMTYLGLEPPYRDLDAAAAGFAAGAAGSFAGVTPERWRENIAAVWAETPAGLVLRYDPRLRDAVIAQASTSTAVDLWPLFERLAGLPVLLIRGANSDILSAEVAARMRALRPDMDYVEVADRGHVPFLDEPEVVAALGRYLDRIAP